MSELSQQEDFTVQNCHPVNFLKNAPRVSKCAHFWVGSHELPSQGAATFSQGLNQRIFQLDRSVAIFAVPSYATILPSRRNPLVLLIPRGNRFENLTHLEVLECGKESQSEVLLQWCL